jgi:hypothetical protein
MEWSKRKRLGGSMIRRMSLIVLVVLALGGAVSILAFSRSDSNGAVTSDRAEIRQLLLARLHAHLLEPLEVVCIPSGRHYEGAAVIRCNVNYGDPHVEAVCSVLRGGDLVTNHDDRTIPCGPDLAGKPTKFETY